MKHRTGIRVVLIAIIISMCIAQLSSCDRNASPEGRMSMKLESLQKEMIDSLRRQNKAILDSIGSLRAEIKELRQKIK
jgi:nucleoside-triphosphatase THEP1